MRRAAKVDANQAEIVAALRKAGATVTSIASVGRGVPDLLVGHCEFRGVETNWLLECKVKGEKLTPAEVEWHADWRGQVAIVFSAEEALRVVGLL